MKINTIQFLASSSHTMSHLFIPIFAKSLGASFLEVGIITAAFGAASFLSSFIFGKAADINRLRPIVLAGLIMSALSFFLQIFAYDAVSLTLIRALAGFSMSIYPAALIVYIYYQKGSIGKFSSYGSLGWMAGFLLAAFVEDVQYLFMLSSLFYCVAFVTALGLKDVQKPSVNVSYFSVETFVNNSPTYISVFIRHAGAGAVWIALPLYLAEMGASSFWIGIIFAINPFIQFLVMRRLDSLRNEWLVKWGFILTGMAFMVYFLAPGFVFMVPGMLLIAFGWSFLFVGANQLLVQRNREKATASGILNSVIAAASIAGSVAGGLILEFSGYKETMIFGVVCAFVGMFIFKSKDVPLEVVGKLPSGMLLKD
ncbi:MFS transporter [Methanolobus zinderi]|uniref:MFS transporter n=1 Tax=Methanolobus zinderi TaxID=536044 RepID=A0A7D5I3Y2_9EURY|nr:MFS transporter [Methanolobus zinderi]QLC49304.1 MFS transporter [Methanolobus zinderi]